MGKIRIGIIGTGNISHCHVDGYNVLGDVEIYAVCDIDEKKVKEYAIKYNVKHVYTDYNEMLKLEEIDAISVCTYNSSHAAAAIAALKAGKHVFCEKPMAMNSKEAIEMKKAADDSGKLLMIGFVRRFGKDVSFIKDYMDEVDVGEIYFSKVCYLRRHGFPGGWFGDKKFSGGGPMIDLGVHVIDLAMYIMGKPKPVAVSGATFYKMGERNNVKQAVGYMSSTAIKEFEFSVEDLAVAMIRFDNGAVINVETSFNLNIKGDTGTIELFGTNAGIKIGDGLEIYTECKGNLINVTPAFSTALDFTGIFRSEVAHFIDCIRNGTECISPAEDGVVLMQILEAVYKSAELGREVNI